MTKLDGKSLDIVSENVEKLKELFPEAFSEGKIDFVKLQEELGEFTDKENERYNFTWNGKQEAKRIAQTPSTGTLRPSKEDSKNWDTTQNLYIEGDNLEVLKLLQKSYHKKVKMIYIDPPYNTGKDFVYKDNFRDNIKNYMEQTGQVDSDGNRLSTNSDTNGRYHSDWLSMMYPRLKLARNLLKDDGVIFISIDDNEVVNLRKLCDEIFGEDNVEELIWNKESEGSSGTLKQVLRFRVIHETVIVCYKDKSTQNFSKISEPLIGRENELQTANLAVNEANIKEGHSNWMKVVSPTGKEWYKHWKFNNEEIKRLLDENLIYWGKDGNNQPRLIIPTDHRRKVYANSIIQKGGTTQGRKDYEDVMAKETFSYPKPISLINFLIRISNSDGIVLDFFSGSATTAHSLIQLNSEDNGTRKYICIQLPEETDTTSEAYKAGYKNICEIGKERIRRAGEKIIADNPDKDLSKLDIGFKVYKLDSSNIKEWDSDFDNLEANLLDSVDNIKSDRTSEDLLYEILLKYGLDLTLPIEELTIEGKTVYNIGFGALVVCLDDNITITVVEAIAEFIKEQVVYDEEKKKRHARVVFKDGSFADTNVKTNAIQVLKQFDIDEVVSV